MTPTNFAPRPPPVIGQFNSLNFQYLDHPHDRYVVASAAEEAAKLAGVSIEPTAVLAFFDAARVSDRSGMSRAVDALRSSVADPSIQDSQLLGDEAGTVDRFETRITVRNPTDPSIGLVLSAVSFAPRHRFYGKGLVQIGAFHGSNG